MHTKLSYVLILLACVLYRQAQSDCMYNGKLHEVGPIETDNACYKCSCPANSEIVSCAIFDCYYGLVATYCPDGSRPIHHPGVCCPTCPSSTTAAKVAKK